MLNENIIKSVPKNVKAPKFYYISDIHLVHQLNNRFSEEIKFDRKASKYLVKLAKKSNSGKQKINRGVPEILAKEIKILAEEIINSAKDRTEDDYLLIAGDVSFGFDIAKLFYSEISNLWKPSKIITILGNHELWAGKSRKNIDLIINNYRKMFKSLGIIFLQNEIYLKSQEKISIIGENEILSNSKPIKDQIENAEIIVLGSLGFSGFNKRFNALNRIYRSAIRTFEEDFKQTVQFFSVYDKFCKISSNKTVIVLTHTQLEDWNGYGQYLSNCIYVNGHTHCNFFKLEKERTVYADNQIGYKKVPLKLKYFELCRPEEFFNDEDGIFPISTDKYIRYGITRSSNKISSIDGQIFQLNRDGFSMFVIQKNNNLYLLNGGKIKKLQNHNINYYFENMSSYATTILEKFDSYWQLMEKISSEIKKFKGYGTIHGCIVDIDFFNHIYVNPYDLLIVPYYATTMKEKYVYQSVEMLIKNKVPHLLTSYNRYTEDSRMGIIAYLENLSEQFRGKSEAVIFVPETDIYRDSRILRTLQHIKDEKIIRIWSDEILGGESQLTVSSLESEEEDKEFFEDNFGKYNLKAFNK